MENFEKSLVYFSASTLRGERPACVVPLKKELFLEQLKNNFRCFKIFEGGGLKMKIIPRGEKLFLLFVYNETSEREIWRDEKVRVYLAGKKYPVEEDFQKSMDELFRRLSASTLFPYEVGIFLGYSLDEVLDFEKSGGRNYEERKKNPLLADMEVSENLLKLYKAS